MTSRLTLSALVFSVLATAALVASAGTVATASTVTTVRVVQLERVSITAPRLIAKA